MKNLFYTLLVFVCCIQVGYSRTTGSNLITEQTEISVLTIGTGPMLHELYGHTAIRVFDPSNGIDRVYNFGMFDFSTPNFGLRFIKGDMSYFAIYTTMREFVYNYVYTNRSVYEQVLNLTVEQKREVWDSLNEAMMPENKYYVYKFIDQNCTTKVVDIVNQSTHMVVEANVPENTKTYREIFNDFLDNSYFLKLGINMILGGRIDKVNDKQFLPDKYMQGLEKTQVEGKPLVLETVTVFEAKPELKPETPWWDTYLAFSIICLMLVGLAYKFRAVRYTIMLLLGVLGLFFIFVNFYSDHVEVLNNNILLLCSPLFVLVPFVRRSRKWSRIIHLVLLVSLTAYVVLNITSEKLIVTLPLYLLTLCVLILHRVIKSKKD